MNRRGLLGVGLVGAMIALSSCTVTYSPPAGGPASSSGDASSTSAPSVSQSLRQSYASSVDQVISCPEGMATIDEAAVAVALDDDCESVRVSGAGVIVLAEHIGALVVDADAATVVVDTADTIDVSGTANVVVWEAGAPQVTVSGSTNTVGPAEAVSGQ